ncbi:MAG: glutamate--tRNA ligase family protein, partial [Deltaproteobacteria bacterium]
LPPRYDGRCRDGKPEGVPSNAAAIRFKVPDGKIEFEDMVHRRLSFEGAGMGDFIIIGSDNVATYNFAAAIDDSLMNITHVIRGDDHLSNTPRQIAVLNALGLEPPFYGHIPLVLSKDKTPLSKRDAALSVAALRENGYLKEAVLNSVARLGWSPGLRRVETPVNDLLTLNEMEILFNASALSKSPSIFDEESLKKYNRDAIAFASPESLYGLIAPEFKDMPREKLVYAIALAKNGAETTIEIGTRIKAVLKKPAWNESVCLLLSEERSKKILKTLAIEVLKTEKIDEASWKTVLAGLKKTDEKGKALFMPIRAALTGSIEGMEIENIARILGRDEILKRIKDGENACP